MENRVADFLTASHRAKRLASLSFGIGRELAVWENSHDEVQYSATQGHAFSLYLKGGTGTSRVDGKGEKGGPGAFCIFPEGHSSSWHINDTFQFVHLYVADDVLRGAFARVHDQDARRLDVSERTLVAPGAFEEPLRRMAQASISGDILSADTEFFEIVAVLTDRPVRLSGGLTRKTLRDVTEWVDENLDAQIRLSDLAALSNLSEFHFHRMFRQTCGLSPHDWLTQLRIERAKTLLHSLSTSETALACGFSNQSHLIRRFKKQMGITPGQYLRMKAS